MAILDDKLKIMALTEWPGVTQGTLANNTARNTNRININAAIAHAAANNKKIFAPPGTYEIYGGPVNIFGSQFSYEGTTSTLFLQYQLDQAVLHIGPPVGTPGIIFGTSVIGGYLRYNGVGAAGAHALEMNGLYRCRVGDFLIGDPYATFAGRTSVPWMSVYVDQAAGTTPSFSNTFFDIHMKHCGFRGWSQFRDNYDAATGNVYSNVYFGCGDNTGVGDLSTVGGSAFYFGSLAQSVFNQVNVEWVASSDPFHLEVVSDTVFNSVNFEGVKLKAGAPSDMALIQHYMGTSEWNGLTVNDCDFLSSDNVQNPSIFKMASNTRISVNTIRPLLNNRTAADLVVFRTINGAGESDVHVDLKNIVLGDADQVSRVDGLILTDSGAGFGLVSDFNSGTPLVLSNASVTHYTYRTPGCLRMTPSGGNKTITLSRQCSSTQVTRIPRSVVRDVHCVTGSASSIVVANYNAATLATLAAGTSGRFAFDGEDWIRVG